MLLNHCNVFLICLLTGPPSCSAPTCGGCCYMTLSSWQFCNICICKFLIPFNSAYIQRRLHLSGYIMISELSARLPNVSFPIGCGKIVWTHRRSRVTRYAGKVNRSFECYVNFLFPQVPWWVMLCNSHILPFSSCLVVQQKLKRHRGAGSCYQPY